MPHLMKIFKIVLVVIFINIVPLLSAEYLEVLPQNGDGLKNIFQRYRLDYTEQNVSVFNSLNQSKLGSSNSLYLGVKYKLPIQVIEYNGKSIRTSISNSDFDYAVTIQEYNDLLFSKGIKKSSYKTDKVLLVPEITFYLKEGENIVTTNNTVTKTKKTGLQSYKEPLFGERYSVVNEISHKLKDNIYYLVGGHGGPDPGAIGRRYGNELHEDEYAYDIILRLAKCLMEHGATVKIIVQDKEDGIRDDVYLNNSYNEVYYGDQEIPRNQLERLRKRVEIVNNEYYKNQNSAKEQIVVPIHVDSRENKSSRIDIFFYHNQSSERGKVIASTLLETIESKYRAAQPGRGYNGSVSARGLYMLRNTVPVTVYIELGNIQNEQDQIRLIEKNNRQAIANWLTDGFLKLAE